MLLILAVAIKSKNSKGLACNNVLILTRFLRCIITFAPQILPMKRVVITGLGVVAPNGNNLTDFWNNVVNGRSAASPITRFNAENFKTRFASQISNFDAAQYLDRNDIKRGDLYTQYALVAAGQAIADSGFDINAMSPFDVGVIFGSAQGGTGTFEQNMVEYAAT